jgi:hypothetical protein
MLPVSNLHDIFYPMTAELYYSESKQNALGIVEKNWVYDRTIKCSIISAMSDKTITGEIKNTSSSFKYDSEVVLRTNSDIQEKHNGTIYPITEILITNVKDPSGRLVWREKNDKGSQFELKTFVPSYNYSHNVEFYRGYLSRSTKQAEVLY